MTKAINRMAHMPVSVPAALFLGTRISDPDVNISTSGLGEPHAIAPTKNADGADNPFGHALNRRVSIIIEKPAAPASAA
jgi:outer membrane protein OmpA-like peptidoglycan-associated protein